MFDVIIISKIIYSFRLIIIFFLFKKNPDMSNYVILNYFFIFLSTFFFFFRFKNCLGVSNYSIIIYSAIMLVFLSFFIFVSKIVLISRIILSFKLYLFIFSFFSISFLLNNRSNYFLKIGLIFFISCSSQLFISNLDIMIGL